MNGFQVLAIVIPVTLVISWLLARGLKVGVKP